MELRAQESLRAPGLKDRKYHKKEPAVSCVQAGEEIRPIGQSGRVGLREGSKATCYRLQDMVAHPGSGKEFKRCCLFRGSRAFQNYEEDKDCTLSG